MKKTNNLLPIEVENRTFKIHSEQVTYRGRESYDEPYFCREVIIDNFLREGLLHCKLNPKLVVIPKVIHSLPYFL